MVHNALGFLVYYKVQNSRKSPRVRRISDSRFGLGFICIFSTVVCIFSSFREVSRVFSSCYLVPHIAGEKKHEVIKFYSEYGFWECYCYVRLATDLSHLVCFHFPLPSLIYLLGVLESHGSSGHAAFWSA